VWEPDELVIVLQEVRDTEYLKKLHVEVGKVLPRPQTPPSPVNAPSSGIALERRI